MRSRKGQLTTPARSTPRKEIFIEQYSELGELWTALVKGLFQTWLQFKHATFLCFLLLQYTRKSLREIDIRAFPSLLPRSRCFWVRGSAITRKYPSCILLGDDSVGEFYSVALTHNYQQAVTGSKMIHVGKNIKSTIISKGISADTGRTPIGGS